mgnify:FL=1
MKEVPPMAAEVERVPVSVAIPTYGREAVLVRTVEQLLAQRPAAAEILVLDQTIAHEPATDAHLRDWHAAGRIRWIRIAEPSQPQALNRGLRCATQEIVLCLDDDVEVEPAFVGAHARCYADAAVVGVAGQVLQPGQAPRTGYVHVDSGDPLAAQDFDFSSAAAAWVRNGMSGNLSFRRAAALAVGGFDENFLPPVSYRFDAEFCARLCRAGGRLRFEPAATVRHLRAARGGTRTTGSHLTSASPAHGVGDYYFALRCGRGWPRMRYLLRRPFREVWTRFHLLHPWWIPVKFVGELRALALALRLHRRGPRLLESAGA